MKKISIFVALILILGFANQSFAYYEYNMINGNASADSGIFVRHEFSYSMAKKMLKHPNRIYPIKYEEILALYINCLHNNNWHFWLEKVKIQNFFENELPKNENINRLPYYMKLIKDNKNFHNYYVDYYVEYLPEYQKFKQAGQKRILLAKARAEAREKAFLASNRGKAITIVENYCSRHNGCEMEYNDHDVNGYHTYSGSSFTLAGNPISGGNFMITQSLFSTQLQNQLVFMLKQNGFLNASTVNLTSAFVSYITLPGARVFSTIQGLTDMVSSGNLKDFNTLLNLFVKHFIKINR